MLQAHEITLSDLFSAHEDERGNKREHSYFVPKYQRAYGWKKENLEDLKKDINENNRGYFIGVLITLPTNTKNKHECAHELIDGQQRLMTLAIYLMALYSKLGSDNVREEASTQAQKQFLTDARHQIRKLLIIDNDKKESALRITPLTQDVNLDDFKFSLKETGVIDSDDMESPSRYGNRRIGRALKFFKNQLPGDPNSLKKLFLKILRLKMLKIVPDSYGNAHLLFENINYKGTPLAEVDIIKNIMLGQLEKENKDVDEAFKKWEEMLLNLSESNKARTSFFQHYYNAFQHKIGPDGPTPPIGRAALIKTYEKLIKGGAYRLLDDLIKKAKLYSYLIPETGSAYTPARGLTADIIEEISNLNRIQANPSYALLLYLLSKISKLEERTVTFKKIVEYLQIYFLRLQVTNHPPTNTLDKILVQTISECDGRITREKRKISAKFILDKLVNCNRRLDRPALDDVFQNMLSQSLCEHNEKIARYLLVQINKSGNAIGAPNLWEGEDGGKRQWTIEHILPKTEILSVEWVNMIAGDVPRKRPDAEKTQRDFVNCLGNLTMLRQEKNSALSNRPFVEKQADGYQDGLYLHQFPYSENGVPRTLATHPPEWTKESITARNKAMVDWILNKYKFPIKRKE